MIFVLSKDKNHYIEEYIKTHNTIFAIKIYARFKNYIGQEIVDIWVQITDNKPVALISSSDGYVNLDVTEKCNFDEIITFLNTIGYRTLSFDSSVKQLGTSTKSGSVMKLNNYIYSHFISSSYDYEILLNDYKSAYEVLKSAESDNFLIPSYEQFILDMSHKVRNKAGDILIIFKDNIPIATSSVVYKCEFGAVIGAVAVKKDYRHLGLGQAIMNETVNIIKKDGIKSIFLQCNNKYTENFYKSFGFTFFGNYTEILKEIK